MAQTSVSRCPFEHIENPELEAEQIAETIRLTVQLLDKRYPPPEPILRGVHPKSHGCVKAVFEINPDIAPEFQVGHSLRDHQPIGSINRLRQPVYQASAQHRLKEDLEPMPFFIRLLEKFFKFLFG